MAALTVIKPGHTEGNMGTGDTPAGGGDTFVNDGVTLLRFTNTSGSPITVTVVASTDATAKCSHGFAHDVAVTVPATTGDVVIGPFPTGRFNNPTTGAVSLTYSGVTNLKVWVLSAGSASVTGIA